MEFLDPKAEHRHRILLLIGYGLIAIAIGFASLIMLYYSYGYSLSRAGDVEQSGLVFVSSTPDGAKVSFDNTKKTAKTNTKITLESGNYNVKISATGYRDWNHSLNVLGGDVQRLDYALLFPKVIKTSQITTFSSNPAFTSQSPDKKWIIIKPANSDVSNNFTVYDMRQSDSPSSQEISVADDITTKGDGVDSWMPVEWSSDNRHLLMMHTYTAKGTENHEYIMFDRTDGAQAVNLTSKLSLDSTDQLTLFDKRSDRFYAYNSTDKTLRSFDVNGKVLGESIDRVRAYKTYGSDTILCVLDPATAKGQTDTFASVVLIKGAKRLVLRHLPVDDQKYLLAAANYGGSDYVAIGAETTNGVFVYRNPYDQHTTGSNLPRAWRFLPVAGASTVTFSDNSRFILVSNRQSCDVYDAENISTHRFVLPDTIDSPQASVSWMDGHRLVYVSGGRMVVTDFDNTNRVVFQMASASNGVFFSDDYKFVYSYSQADSNGLTKFESTALRIVK